MKLFKCTQLPLTIVLTFLLIAGLLAGPAQAQAPDEDIRTVSMDFDQIDIQVFIKFISELTGRNFVVDDNVRGKVTVLSPSPVSVEEAFTVFESVLEVHGYTTIQSGGVTKVVPSVEARQKNIETGVTPSAQREPTDRFVTRIIPLQHASSNEVRKVLAPLISKQGILVAYPPNETLILTDYASNIQRMMRIISQIDVVSYDSKLNVIYLEHGSAEKIVAQIQELLQARRGGGDQPGTLQAVVADERMNAIIILASKENTRQIQELISKLDRPTPVGKSKVQVVRLENALAQDLAEVLSGLISKAATGEDKVEAISRDITVVADKATNSIVVTAEPEEFAVLEPIIKNLDSPRKQVFIEAAIMEVSDTKIQSLGVNWNVADTMDGVLGVDEDTVAFGGSNPGGFPNLFQGNTLVPPSGLSLGLISFPFTFNGQDVFNLATLVNLAKSSTDFDVLSYPQVMTMENEEAKIIVADNIPFTTQTDTGLETDSRVIQSIDYRDVGVTLQVTPQINNQGSVKLKIFQEVSRIVEQVVRGEGNNIVAIAPTTKKRTAETMVEVKNGSTIVIAGLMEESNQNSNQGVPGLSDVPMLGWLFKSKSKSSDRTNLVIFITPHIIRNPNDAQAIYHDKAKFMQRVRFGADGRAAAINKPYLLHDPVVVKTQ
ncbi:MAG: type II secretion system secretin GspD [Desulfovibrionales bacterium]